MSFILNYLDEALDKVTGRYDDDDDKEDLGSSDEGGDVPSIPVDREKRAKTTGDYLAESVATEHYSFSLINIATRTAARTLVVQIRGDYNFLPQLYTID